MSKVDSYTLPASALHFKLCATKDLAGKLHALMLYVRQTVNYFQFKVSYTKSSCIFPNFR